MKAATVVGVVSVFCSAACGGGRTDLPRAESEAPAAVATSVAVRSLCDGLGDCPDGDECMNVWCWQLPEGTDLGYWGRCVALPIEGDFACDGGTCKEGRCVPSR